MRTYTGTARPDLADGQSPREQGPAAGGSARGGQALPQAGRRERAVPDQAARWLRWAMCALGVLAASAAVVSFQAQYRMISAAKEVRLIAALEAGIPDTAAVVFAALAIALALHGKRALRPRALNLAAVATSIFMNFAAAAGANWRTVAIWVMPSVAYALASDTGIGVVRAWAIAQQKQLDEDLADEGTTPLDVLAGFLLWVLRLVMDPPGTVSGFRAWVLRSCPVAPGTRMQLPSPNGASVPQPGRPPPRPATAGQAPGESTARSRRPPARSRRGGRASRPRSAPPTVEEVAERFADQLAAGQLPSQKQIRAQWPIGSSTAKKLREGLRTEPVAAAGG